VTWAVIRVVTAFRVCGPGVCGTLSMMAGARSRRPCPDALTERIAWMLPDAAALPVPASLMTLLAVFSPLFTVPSFRTFCGLACGFLAQSGKRTVCGMLIGAALSRLWSHDRAHYFFSRARWNPDDLGIAVATLVIALLAGDGEAVEVLIDDTLFRRRGKKVWAASWFHDGSAQGPAKNGVREQLGGARGPRADQPEPQEIHAIRLAWDHAEDLAA
jgi:hypothetical protein